MNAKATHIFFSKNISVYAIFNDQSFNDTLTNEIVSFEQLGPVLFLEVGVYYCSNTYSNAEKSGQAWDTFPGLHSVKGLHFINDRRIYDQYNPSIYIIAPEIAEDYRFP